MKNIGANPHIMAKGGGRFNTIEEILQRYLMSQSYVTKAGTFISAIPTKMMTYKALEFSKTMLRKCALKGIA